MPVAQSTRTPVRQALLVGLGAAMGLVAIVFLVTQADRLTGSADLDIQIGDGIFRPGPADDLAPAIAEQGPLFLSDLAGGDTDIWITHDGDDPERGWAAFGARPPTAPRDCFVEWQADDEVFVDNCDGAVYPADGAGLPQYAVGVDADGLVAVDLTTPLP